MTDTIIRYKPNGERDYVLEHYEREKAENLAQIKSHSLVKILGLSVYALVHLLFLPFRHGYGKQYLWALFILFFVAPVLLFGGAFLYAMCLHPQAFLTHWEAFAGTHPAAASWTWLLRDASQWVGEMK
ncbi:hypothetical protein [Acidithiobacillus sp.]|uniref:hypothetical protein n=1 Tax=Acidithiobacillus sp. TaxID=1872118 RepID=UPI003CFE021B